MLSAGQYRYTVLSEDTVPIKKSSMEGDHESRSAAALLLWSPYGILLV